MRRTARRVVVGTAAGVVMAVAVAGGVSAHWQAQQQISVDAVASGDLSISADWIGGPPTWPDVYPGQSTPDATVRVQAAGVGDTLTWRLRVTGTTSAGFASHTEFQAWIGACGGSTPIPPEGAGSFTAATTTVDVCVRYTLSPTAPNSLQGAAMQPTVTVTAEQVSG